VTLRKEKKALMADLIVEAEGFGDTKGDAVAELFRGKLTRVELVGSQ
jgi:hypothetical protein